MRKFLVLLLIACFVLATCYSEPSTDKAMREATEQSFREANSQIGMPGIRNYQERKLAKMIFELRDQENLICYAYIVAKMTGNLKFFGKCVGFGLPYSVQYTSPEKMVYHHGNRYILPQADPNGLFMPEGLSATWIMLIDPKTGKARPTYVEPEIIVSPFKLH